MTTVAWFFETFPFAGAEKVALDLAREFTSGNYGVRPVIIARRFSKRPDGIECVDFDCDAPLRKPQGQKALAGLLRDVGADIYIQAMDPQKGLLQCLRHELPEMRIIVHLHNRPYWQVARKCACRPLSRLREKLFATYTRRYRRRYADDYAAADCWVTLCNAYTAELRADLGPKIFTINNPADLRQYLPLRACPKQREVLYIGRLSRGDKRVDRVIRAWADVSALHPAWKLKIVGSGPDEQALKRLAATHAAERVEFCGHSDNPAAHYATASILVQTSDYEGWPLVLVEAMAAGVRCLAMECSAGVEEIMARGRGRGVAAGDERAFARTLSEMMTRVGGAPESDSAGFLSELTPAKVAGQWVSLFEKITANACTK